MIAQMSRMSGVVDRVVQEIVPVERLVPGLGSLHVKRSGWLKESLGCHCVKVNCEHNLHFVLSGRGKVLVDGQEHEMRAGDVFMFFPGHRTEHYDFPGERWEYYWVALGTAEGMAQALETSVAAAGLTEAAPRMRLPSHSELWTFMPRLHRRLREGSYGGIFPVAAAWRILDGLARPDISPPLAVRVRNYVESTDGMFGVNELALRFEVSRATLHRVFSQAFGESLKDCLQRRRFAVACELLEGSSLDVQQVAEATGFASVQYFCRAFNARFGTSPGSWRKIRCGNSPSA